MTYPLFSHFPELEPKLPRLKLGVYPTSVYHLKGFGKILTHSNIWIKQDNLAHPVFGGNKVRKLELELAKLIQLNKDHIISYGAMGSNFTAAAAIFSKEIGLNNSAILFPAYLTDYSRFNYNLTRNNATRVTEAKTPLLLPYHIIKEKYQLGKRSYVMPPGGTSPRSTFGYINGMLELNQQIQSGIVPKPDYIFLPTGTGGTLAGLLIGKEICQLETKIIPIVVVEKCLMNKYLVSYLIYQAVQLWNKWTSSDLNWYNIYKNLELDYRFLGKGYSWPLEEGNQVIDAVQQMDSIRLDSCYSGKAMTGLVSYIKSGHLKNKTVLFWNTYHSLY